MSKRLSWPPIIERAKEIALSYDTPVTLRQLFYRLVAEGIIPNTESTYKTLSSRTAEARRAVNFPKLADLTREIWQLTTFTSPNDARNYLRLIYRRDRTEGQSVSLFIGVEKATMLEQLADWFNEFGIPILALRGYSSQTYVDEVVDEIHKKQRQAVLIYAGDFDTSGVDIDRDFTERTACFDEVIRVAVNPQQINEYGLIPMPGKKTDSRAPAFKKRYGELLQVELEAIDPSDVRDLFQEALEKFLDKSRYEDVLKREAEERDNL